MKQPMEVPVTPLQERLGLQNPFAVGGGDKLKAPAKIISYSR